MSVRCLVYTFDFSRLVSWWAAASCLAILRPLRNLLLHRESKCGQVSLSFIWHNVQLELGCVWPVEILYMISHVLGESELEELCDSGIRSLWGFPKVVRQFVVNFLIGEPFFRICEFYGCFFCEPIVLCFYECL